MNTTVTDPVSSSTSRTVERIPQGMRTVTPHLVCANAAEAIDFYVKAFGAVEMVRVPAADGRLMHACLRLGDAAIMLVDEFPEWECKGPKALHGTPVTIHLYVGDADAAAERAVQAGAKIVMPVQEMFWGDRYGVLEDPFGHRWSVATHVRDVTPEELQEAAKNACCGPE
jgi:uncharacterized glyoxalase superfamily protein PhnB